MAIQYSRVCFTRALHPVHLRKCKSAACPAHVHRAPTADEAQSASHAGTQARTVGSTGSSWAYLGQQQPMGRLWQPGSCMRQQAPGQSSLAFVPCRVTSCLSGTTCSRCGPSFYQLTYNGYLELDVLVMSQDTPTERSCSFYCALSFMIYCASAFACFEPLSETRLSP